MFISRNVVFHEQLFPFTVDGQSQSIDEIFGDIEVMNEAVVDNETEEVVETEVLSEAEIENA